MSDTNPARTFDPAYRYLGYVKIRKGGGPHYSIHPVKYGPVEIALLDSLRNVSVKTAAQRCRRRFGLSPDEVNDALRRLAASGLLEVPASADPGNYIEFGGRGFPHW